MRLGILIVLILSTIVSGQEPARRLRLLPGHPPDFFDNRSVDLARIAPERCTVELDNERMRVIRIVLPAESRIPIHSHRPGIIVAVKELSLRVVRSNGSVTDVQLPAGDIRWMDATAHSEQNIGAVPAEYLFIEAKN